MAARGWLSRPKTLLWRAGVHADRQIAGSAQPPVLLPGEPRLVTVAPGESLLECTSATVAAVTIKRAVSVIAGTKQSVSLGLAELVVKASCADKPATLADLGNGVLRHCVSRTDWTQADSGLGGLDWDVARARCATKGAGWKLPTADELAELIDRRGGSKTTCGRFTCHVSPLFRLTAPIFWTTQVTGPSMIMQVSLLLGGRHPTAQDANYDYRALCVRNR